MEQNQNPTQTTPTQQPTIVIQPTPTSVVSPLPSEKNSKMLYLLLATIIIVGIGTLGIFFFTNRQTDIQKTKLAAPIVPQVSTIPSPLPTTPIVKTPEQQLQDVTIDDPTADITDINTDLNQL